MPKKKLPKATDRDEEVIRRYARSIAHMWRQRSEGKLSLIFGAGASEPIGFPKWNELIGLIQKDPDINEDTIETYNAPLPTAAEVLFQRYRMRHISGVKRTWRNPAHVEKFLFAGWRKIVHRNLYASIPSDDSELESRDNVYKHFLDVVRAAPLTINYNFDDSLERLLLSKRTENQRSKERGFKTITDTSLPFRLSTGNILHPNGFLPHNLLEAVDDTLIFSDATFADQLIDSMAGAYSTLLHYLTKHTFLLVGISLEDETLRHLLRQNALLNPGHYHYRVQYVSARNDLNPEAREALVQSYFATYNLITMFLDSEGIASLGKCLSSDSNQLKAMAERAHARLWYVYYITGVPGAGKTTTFRHFSSLVAHDEWLEERNPLLSKRWEDLKQTERQQVDNWVCDQVRLKNNVLTDAMDKDDIGVGINVVDRCPLDAISFTTPRKWGSKAFLLRNAIADGRDRVVVEGCVIVLKGDPEEMMVRALSRDRQQGTTKSKISWQQDATLRVYSRKGVRQVECCGLSISEVIKTVANIIFHEPYTISNLQKRIKGFESGTLKPPTKYLLPSG